MTFLSWTYDASQLDLALDSDSVDTSSFETVDPYSTIDYTTAGKKNIFYPCCPEAFPQITYTLCFKYK